MHCSGPWGSGQRALEKTAAWGGFLLGRPTVQGKGFSASLSGLEADSFNSLRDYCYDTEKVSSTTPSR